MLEIKDLHASINGKEILKGINLVVKPGEVHAIMGPNGSGKYTLLKSILGLVIPEKGKILVNETDIKTNCLYRNNIGYMPQIANYPENLKVKELFSIVKDIRSGFKVNDEELLEKFRIYEIYDKLN